MNIAGIDYESVKDGEGMRSVIYTTSCSHNCKGCHNPETHNPNYGVKFTKELQEEIIDNIRKRPYISGITWSGGDPLHENNLEDVLDFTHEIRLSFPEKTIWLYSGYTWQEVFENNQFIDLGNGYSKWSDRAIIVSKCDVFIDGKYEELQRDITLRFRGSKNQRVIDVQQSLKSGDIVLHCD